MQVWRWRDLVLLLLRLAMLTCLIAVGTVLVGHRGDTVFVSAKVDPAWLNAEVAEIKQNGAKPVSLIRYCDRAECELQTSAIFALVGTTSNTVARQ